MKVLFVLAFVLVAGVLAEDKAEEKTQGKIYKRLIPADVLRDFPGMCFASTKCATVEPGKTWDLTPFCGRSTCVLSEDKPPRLLELVEDCGPLPLANPKCKLDEEKTNKTAPFPYCCPQFACEEGAVLEYPEIPTVAPVPGKLQPHRRSLKKHNLTSSSSFKTDSQLFFLPFYNDSPTLRQIDLHLLPPLHTSIPISS